jgi:hypothetical protein
VRRFVCSRSSRAYGFVAVRGTKAQVGSTATVRA